MCRETEEDFKLADDYQTRYESAYQEALDEMYELATKIALTFEHNITEVEGGDVVELCKVEEVARGILSLRGLAYYDYKVWVEGKYRGWHETIEYNFESEMKDFLCDNLGVCDE